MLVGNPASVTMIRAFRDFKRTVTGDV
jgi:hypothetical protein